MSKPDCVLSHDKLRWFHKLLDMDPDTFDWCKPVLVDIRCLWYIPAHTHDCFADLRKSQDDKYKSDFSLLLQNNLHLVHTG